MNQQNKDISREISFRITGKTPEIWNPEYGSVVRPSIYRMDEKYTTLPICLAPQQSLIFVFRNEKPNDYIQTVKQNGIQLFPSENNGSIKTLPNIVLDSNSFVAISIVDSEFELITSQQKKYTLKPSKGGAYEIADFSGNVVFDPKYSGTIPPITFTELRWINESENPDIKYFSGIAKYVISFAFPMDKIQQMDSILLDIGEFESIAEVKMNSVNLGNIWKPGKLLSIKGILKKDNVIEVSVANTFRNRFIGDFIQYGKIQNLWTSSPISDFLKKDYPLKASGLKGPLRIIAIKKQICQEVVKK
jgi:hypothetical protein